MTKRYGVILTFLLAASFAVPLTGEAATLYLSPSSGNYYKGENFQTRILVNSDVAINAVSGVLNFPTRYVKIISVDKKNSILNFWIEEPSFSNAGTSGNVRFEGVVLNPGFTGSGGSIATITFRVDDAGAADFNFSQSAILANDGLGTNVGTSAAPARFTLLPQRISPAPAQDAAPEPQVIFIKQLSQENLSNISSFWEAMPGWVQVSIAITIGLATIILSLIILSLGAIVLVWLWSNMWHRRYQFFFLLHSSANAFKNVVRKALHSLGMAEREVKGDINYGMQQLAEEFKKVSRPLSFNMLMRDYFSLVYNIVRRFFTKNVTEVPDEPTRD